MDIGCCSMSCVFMIGFQVVDWHTVLLVQGRITSVRFSGPYPLGNHIYIFTLQKLALNDICKFVSSPMKHNAPRG